MEPDQNQSSGAATTQNPRVGVFFQPGAQPGASPNMPPVTEPDPKAPADLDEVTEQENRLEDLSTLLEKVDLHVSRGYDNLLDNSDDDTDPPHTSDLAESLTEVNQAYDLQAQAQQILRKDTLTNQDMEELEQVIDDLDAKIESATPMDFDPNANFDQP